MRYEIKHFGTSMEISVLIQEVNQWLADNAGTFDVVAMSESQGGTLGDETDPFYFSLNVVYRRGDRAGTGSGTGSGE
jgi:hypothetical protein